MNNNIMIKDTDNNGNSLIKFNDKYEHIEIVKNLCFEGGFEIQNYDYKYFNLALDYLIEELFFMFPHNNLDRTLLTRKNVTEI